MSQGPVLGIDLGTTNSVVAVADGGQARVLTDSEGRRLLPSVVSFHPNGETLIGYEARERRLVDAANTVYAVKRLIGRPFESSEVKRARERFAFQITKSKHGSAVVEVRRGKYALAEISAMILRQLRRNAESQLGESCERAVITVPANFNELQRSATKAAGKVAGLDVLRIINEPTAAALAYGFGKGARERVAVYDLGGGTFDLTVLELDDDVFEVLATAGDTFLGGEDLDMAIANAMCDAFLQQHGWDPRTDGQAYERLKAAAEWAKCQLSTETETELTVEELTHGKGGRTLDLQYSLSRDGLEAIAQPLVQRTFQVCDEALQNASLRASDIASVVLVGGMTRMPVIQQMVETYFGRAPLANIDPDLVVAQGAAIHGYAVGGPRDVRKPREAASLGKVLLKKMSREEVEARRGARKQRRTMLGMPQQPAFSPEERPASDLPPSRPARPSAAPPPMPPLPDAPTRVAKLDDLDDLPTSIVDVVSIRPSPVVTITTPKSTLDIDLDRLQPGSDLPSSSSLDDLAPPELSSPFANDLDPFLEPKAGLRKGGTLPGTTTVVRESKPPDAALDDPFANLDLPEPPSAPPPARVASAPPVPASAPPVPAARTAPPRPPALPPPAPRPPPPTPPPTPPPPPRVQPVQPTLAMEVMSMPVATRPPILMDVTPHSLAIETVGGYCRKLISKNAPVPTEQTKTFTTARDDQVEVAVRICQGESDTFADNQVLGEVVLDRLPQKARGDLQIDVVFILDADGTLAVQAKDAASGRTQSTRINLRGGLSGDDIEAMRRRLEAEEAR